MQGRDEMLEHMLSFWWPVIVSFFVLIVQIDWCYKKKLLPYVVMTIVYTAFVFYAASFFDLVIILLLVYVYVWLLSFSVYYSEKHSRDA